MTAAATWRKLAWSDRLLLAEAMALLACASLSIALLPFRRVAALAARKRVPSPVPAPPLLARRVRWAVDACARRVPWRAVCFQQALAAQWMLQRRGLSATLHYGARRDEAGELVAHVWVRSRETDVIGCEDAARYSLLATFPAPAGD